MDLLKKLGHKLEDKVEDIFHGDDHEGQHHEQHEEHHQGGEGSGEVRPQETTVNRFQSFAPQSSGHVKWHVDGASYFWAVSVAIESARESIYILDWWLSPELHLRRPPARNEQYRLDNMLKAAAERGVRVNIIVYKEVPQALTLNSEHTKHALEALHPNIKVFRHPDHIPTGRDFAAEIESSFKNLSLRTFDLARASHDALKALYGTSDDAVLFWAHHEKLLVVDNHLAFMGGLDLCFGRWDTNSHPIADVHPGNVDELIFAGQDYNNARVYDFEDVDRWENNKLDRTKSSRMGWSDISISLSGPIVSSLILHFADRWNYIFDQKYIAKDQGKYEKIHPGISHAPASRGLVAEGEQFLGLHHHFRHHGFSRMLGGGGYEEPARQEPSSSEGAHVQLTRSCSPWSAGHKTEHSIANAYIHAISNAKHFVYIENQFFITATSDEQKPVKNKIGAAIVDRILRAHNSGEEFHVIVIMPAVPAFAGDLKSDGALGTRAIMEFQYNSINRGGHSIIESLQKSGVQDPSRYIGFYNLRNYDRINTSGTLSQVEQDSGVSYETARREYDNRVERGYDGYEPNDERRDESQYERYQAAARRTTDETWDSVAACYMASGPDLFSAPWNGSPESELDAFVSEELYIHSKVLIADDQLVICGSANLNDRSQLGDHDSEIAVVIEDPTPVQSTMNGQPWTASAFAASLRRQLFRKHLGLLPHQRPDTPSANWTPVSRDPNEYDWGSEADRLVVDPLDSNFRRLWNDTARTNTEVFSKAFHPVPNDAVRTWDDYENFFSRYFVVPGAEDKDKDKHEDQNRGQVDYGHVVREEFPGGVRELKEWLGRVRGTLVEMPLQFLIDVKDLAKEGLSLNSLTDELYT
ncbi:phospholipase D/nuclease [Thozetella sp. PMI_491]|nr:phospholipase D/nuclease [Thozetella sp. PMI_491]